MTDLTKFSRIAPNRTFGSIILGGLAGLSYALLIPLVLSAIRPVGAQINEIEQDIFTIAGVEIDRPVLAITFAASCLFILIMRTVSQLLLSSAASDIAALLRKRLCDRVLAAPVSAIEAIGARRLDSAIATDIPRIVLGARTLPEILVSSVTLAGMLGFLILRNVEVFWFVIISVTIGAFTYQIPMTLSQRYFIRSRQAQDALHESFASIVRGFKEMKLDKSFSEEFLRSSIMNHDDIMKRCERIGGAVTTFSSNYGDLINFFVIGFVIFVFVNYYPISSDDKIGVIMVLLYITSPVAIILRALPQIAISRVSKRRYADLLDDLPMENVLHSMGQSKPWTVIRLESVKFLYHGNSRTYEVGPIDLEFERGSITFIVGGNGSGKTTLGKLLLMHYPPSSGKIYFGNDVIDEHSISNYRNQVSAVHFDYFLFIKKIGGYFERNSKKVQNLLEDFGLSAAVSMGDHAFSTSSLSDGQRRRLALVQAIVEDRELYFFDEWAADQDPEFKKIFYEKVLLDLKTRGKVVVAITHDDRYFHLADKLVVMEDGKLKSCTLNKVEMN